MEQDLSSADMNWHRRYAQQANWTRDLRSYVFNKIDLRNTGRVLEVGCGTGAILSEISAHPNVHGLDINFDSLLECRMHAPHAFLVRGDALKIPYLDKSFDVVYSHFLLLWVHDPLQAVVEMKRVTRDSGYVIAFAEPDYLHRVDQPKELIPVGEWQTAALQQQGADPGLGGQLAELFHEAGINILETGTIQSPEQEPSPEQWEIEWDVIESDLRESVPKQDIQKMKSLDQKARQKGTRRLHVPTYFAWGSV
jgi:ubiquinone/menaquinone biosynthesis C-methylase UbiE